MVPRLPSVPNIVQRLVAVHGAGAPPAGRPERAREGGVRAERAHRGARTRAKGVGTTALGREEVYAYG